jgi:hypothetical protein
VRLITGTIGRMESDPTLGRADALRLSVLFLPERGRDVEVQPAYGTPFVIAGEGAISSLSLQSTNSATHSAMWGNTLDLHDVNKTCRRRMPLDFIGSAVDFDSTMRRFEPSRPSQ